MAHTTHAVSSASATTAEASHRACVAPADSSGAFAMDAAFAMSGFNMGVYAMRGRVAWTARAAHDLAQVEPVVVRNFTPAFATLELPDDGVEALARCIGQQVGFLQSTPT